MNKLVYLFELDSVRKSKKEIVKAQKALFEEIVLNGNIVVMTMNQLSDSLGFLVAVNDNTRTKHILELFKAGVLRVSSYKSGNELITTPSQYLQNNIQKSIKSNEEDGNKQQFFFSGWFIEGKDQELVKTIQKSLQYNDPGLISDFSETFKGSVESWNGDKKRAALEDIETFIRMILQLSGDTLSINQPKINNGSKQLSDFRKLFISMWTDKSKEQYKDYVLKDIIDNALSEFQQLDSMMRDQNKNLNKRSDWYTVIREQRDEYKKKNFHKKIPKEKRSALKMAEAIIDLCYNYTCEDSICGISRHYSDDNSFIEDFLNRLNLYWQDGKDNTHIFLADEGNAYKYKKIKLPSWTNIAALMCYAHTPRERGIVEDSNSNRKAGGLDHLRTKISRYSNVLNSGELYEKGKVKETFIWNIRIMFSLLLIILKITGYVALFVMINFAAEYFSERLNLEDTLKIFAISSIVFGIFSSAISNFFKMPDILDLAKQIILLIIGFFRVFIFHNIKRIVCGSNSYTGIQKQKKEVSL